MANVEPVDLRRPTGDRWEQASGVALITVGVLLLLRRFGLLFPDQVVWSAALVVMGAGVAWSRLGRRTDLLDGGAVVVARLIGGAVLVAVGVGAFAAHGERFVVATQVLLAVAATTLGVVLLAGPWIFGLARQLTEERRERIRADERAEVAAHLHDSVLQTLALIQRRAGSPAETVALARRQERELREWLHGRRRTVDGETVGSALHHIADDVEARHAVVVDVVVVGDAPVDEAAGALVAAVREAVVNAAKHSGAPTVSVYAEVGDDQIEAYVRDRGAGFDLDRVAADRRGIAESIVGRIERQGGTVEISAGDGTEVVLRLPFRRSVRP